MKIALGVILLVVTANTMALNCISEDIVGNKLVLKQNFDSKLISGESFGEAQNLFVGKKSMVLIGDEYELYNQDGIKYTLFVNKSIKANTHCRAHQCTGSFDNLINNAKLSSDGLDDEYFTCL